MPVFNWGDRQLLFVHVPRTGGQAIEAWFGLDRAGESPDRAALLGRDLREDAPHDLSDGPGFLLEHLTPVEMVRYGYLPDRGRSLSFCVVRDPVDRVVSVYRSRPRAESFKEWLPKFLEGGRHPYRTLQSEFVYDERGSRVVGDVLRHEALAHSFLLFRRRYGLKGSGADLTQVGVSQGRVPTPSPGDLDLILDAYHDDFDLFGYRKEALLKRLCQRIRREGTLTLTFLTKDRLPLFELWWRHARAFVTSDMLVICHDEASVFAAQARGLATYMLRCAPDKFTMSRERVRLMKQIIDSGTNIVYSDLGAMWFRDIRPLLSDHSADFQMGLATHSPEEFVSAWGFACDLGFWRCESNERTRRFWKQLLQTTKELGDIRAAFHALLKAERVYWGQRLRFERRVTSAEGVLGSYSLRLRALPISVVSQADCRGVSIYSPNLDSGPLREQMRALHESLGGRSTVPGGAGASSASAAVRGPFDRRLESSLRPLDRSSSTHA
jgi:hypothetical protein